MIPADGRVELEFGEVAHDLGAGPVLCGDELSSQDALLVDDVGFGDLGGAVEGVDAGVGVADGEEVDLMPGEEALIDVGVLVITDGDYGDAGHPLLELEEAGELFDAGRAPGGPEVEENDVSVELAEVYGAGAVAEDELRGGFADVYGVAAAVASCGEQRCQYDSCPNSAHDRLHFL
jgi:hypothetical protein